MKMTTDIDIPDLIKKHTPVMIMYPEIPSGTVREQEWNHEFRENMKSPLPYDYHPRDVRLVLEYSIFHEWFRWFRRRRKITTWQGMLDRMERVKYRKNLDVFPKVSKSDKPLFWSEYGKIASKDERYHHTCYARLVRGNSLGRDLLVIQYWYAYLYNDFWNAHEMDWETVMVVLDGEGQHAPLICAYSAHEGGHWLPWPEVSKVNDESVPADNGTHPIVYVASGSHANYFTGPAIFRTAPPVLRRVTQLIRRPLARLFPNSEVSRLLNQGRLPLDYTASLDKVGGIMVNAKIISD